MRFLTFVAALPFLLINHAIAQKRLPALSDIRADLSDPANAARLQQKLRRMTLVASGTMAAQQKTTGARERLIADVFYNGGVFDSLYFVYNSSNRGSAFDFESMSYGDFESVTDYPTAFGVGSYIHFDTLRTYSSVNAYDIRGIRTYNTAGKVTYFLADGQNITYFSYDASGRVASTTVLDYNSPGYDSSYRDFYIYNSAGTLIRDSSESWDPMSGSWQSGGVYVFTTNAAGLPTQIALNVAFGPIPITVFQETLTYNAANRPIRSVGRILDFSTGLGLVNYYKDTIGYTANMRTFYNTYGWDTTANIWSLGSEERRHLNAASLPDSIWSRSNPGSGAGDTTITKFIYNANGNPVLSYRFEGSQPTPSAEERWYYAPSNVGITGISARQDITAYPNPVTDMLYLKGASEGRYNIHNAAGQLLQSGTLQAASGIPVSMLPPGIYTFSLQDKSGALHVTQFVRQ